MEDCFTYSARTLQGKLVQGYLQAVGRSAAAVNLKKKGLFILTLDRQPAAWTRWRERLLNRRISILQRALFTRQLATLLKAGMTVTVALKTLVNQVEDKHFSTVISRLYADIEGAESLSSAMAKHPRIFPESFTAVVDAAEQSGKMPETLELLSRRLKHQATTYSRIRSALTYPLFLLAVGTLAVMVLLKVVVPKFVALFVNAEQELPLVTRLLVNAMAWFEAYGLVLLFSPIAMIALFCWLYRKPQSRLVLDKLWLSVPLVGQMNRKIHTTRMAQTLSSLLAGGVRIIEVLSIVARVMTNHAFRQALLDARYHVTHGHSLAQALQKQKCFSSVVINMVAVGEESGSLAEMLDEVAQMYEQQSESAIASITTLLGPVMIISLGLLIGFVVLAILLPIFETTTLIG